MKRSWFVAFCALSRFQPDNPRFSPARFPTSPVLRAAVFVIAGMAAACRPDPSIPTLSDGSGPLNWSGAPPSGQGECIGPRDPACDHYRFLVMAQSGRRITIDLFINNPGDEYQVQVFYPDGTPATSGRDHEPSAPQVSFEHRADRGRGPYEVRVRALRADASSWYQGVASLAAEPHHHPILDNAVYCRSYVSVPSPVGIGSAMDEGRHIELRVLALLDGVPEDRAAIVLRRAERSFADLRIKLVPTYERVNLRGNDAEVLLAQAKAEMGGKVPLPFHVVHILTAKDLRMGGSDIAGLADCIGGIQDRTRAFSIGEVYHADQDRHTVAHLTLQANWSAKIAAHEIGHLLGGAHERANCVEGIPSDAREDLLSACTLMFNALDPASLNFSSLNGAVVRAYALRDAAY